jgi:hypothetical protein
MQMSLVTATIRTTAGNAVARGQIYARRFDVLEDTTLHVGGLYQPYLGILIRQECMDDSLFRSELDWEMTVWRPLTARSTTCWAWADIGPVGP